MTSIINFSDILNVFIIPSTSIKYSYIIISHTKGFIIYATNRLDDPCIPIFDYNYQYPITSSFYIKSDKEFQYQLWFVFQNTDETMRAAYIVFNPLDESHLIIDSNVMTKFYALPTEYFKFAQYMPNDVFVLASNHRLIVVKKNKTINKHFDGTITAFHCYNDIAFLGFYDGSVITFSTTTELTTNVTKHASPVSSIAFVNFYIHSASVDGKLFVSKFGGYSNNKQITSIVLNGSPVYKLFSVSDNTYPIIVLTRDGINVIGPSNITTFNRTFLGSNQLAALEFDSGIFVIVSDYAMSLYSI
ncbi:Uncharacterized protein QTN25_007961 [Entamoeba marina]